MAGTTERLYYDDAYSTEFDAHVVEHLIWDDAPAVVLDRTLFYPEGGGQPADQGTLKGVPVVDVQTRVEDRAVIHVLERPLDIPVGAPVRGQIDWRRRFDHMQQHTAQHILSQAFLRVAEAETIGFHLGEAYTTIDLDRGDVTPEEVARAEELANQVIEDNVPVRARFVDEAELQRLSLRRPPKVSGPIRLVEIGNFDVVPCGGTHVARTGELGLLAVTRTERYKGGLRVTFLAGRRARADYARRRHLLSRIGEVLTCGEQDMVARIERLLAEHQGMSAQLRRWHEHLLAQTADNLWEQAPTYGRTRLIIHVVGEQEPESMRKLAGELRERGPAIILLGWQGPDKSRFLFAATPGLPVHMGQVLRSALDEVGGRGGGRPEWAEGGAGGGAAERVLKAAQAQVEDILRDQ